MFKIRNADILDIEEIYQIEHETYGNHHWSKKSFITEFSNTYSRYLLCELDSENKKILGYAGYWIVSNEGHITTMVVAPKYRRMHIADILLYNLIRSAIHNNVKWLTLEVRVSNLPAIALYSKYCFKQLGVRKNYYQDNSEDALILWTEDISHSEYLDLITGRYHQIKSNATVADIL